MFYFTRVFPQKPNILRLLILEDGSASISHRTGYWFLKGNSLVYARCNHSNSKFGKHNLGKSVR
jgi:hypothetical protein